MYIQLTAKGSSWLNDEVVYYEQIIINNLYGGSELFANFTILT